MLPVLPVLDRYRDEFGTRFKLILPEYNQSAADLFRNANWAHFIDPDEFDRTTPLLRGGHIPATQFAIRTNNDRIDTAHDADLRRRLVELLANASQLEPSAFDGVDYALMELMDNVANHAYDYPDRSPLPETGGYFQATYLHNHSNPAVEFILADRGMGIPQSLRSGHETYWQRQNDTDEELLLDSIELGITRDQSKGQGNGLHLTQQLAVQSGGTFELNSGRAYLWHGDPESKPVSQASRIPYRGTVVRCRIGLSDAELLDRILPLSASPGVSTSLPLVVGGGQDDGVPESEDRGSPSDRPAGSSAIQLPRGAVGVVVSVQDGEFTLHVQSSVEGTSGTSTDADRLHSNVVDILTCVADISLDFGDADWDGEFLSGFLGRLFRESPTRYMSHIRCINIDNDAVDAALAGH
ncbi:MAG: hypothetical protein F4Y35_03720 [Chloroflexi bacterium]|nr:hypothetical protein [Chloroflexota bacterium]